ncbi:CPBP family intramembrane glutamic endopeptidase [Staphylococcus intermedius]|nr:CPBP family intramembrane glutamic endopeptidase [Staphylococcus intermedius]PNZ53943.1 hypothetical protein CD138_03725 [Staphylococcus intermedius NCTC 11048]
MKGNYSMNNNIIKRDFALPFIYIIMISLINFFNDNLYINYTVEIFMILSLFLLWCIFHKDNYKKQLLNGFMFVKSHYKYILILSILMLTAKNLFVFIVKNFAPSNISFVQTQNDISIQNELSQSILAASLIFITSVIGAPIIEEFLFRHLLIGELGKKFNYTYMSVLSLLVFSSLHVVSSKSFLELGPYIIISLCIIISYIKTGKKLSIAISLHFINNLHAYFMLFINS